MRCYLSDRGGWTSPAWQPLHMGGVLPSGEEMVDVEVEHEVKRQSVPSDWSARKGREQVERCSVACGMSRYSRTVQADSQKLGLKPSTNSLGIQACSHSCWNRWKRHHHVGHLEMPINLTACFYAAGRSRYALRKPTTECRNIKQRRDSSPPTWRRNITALSTDLISRCYQYGMVSNWQCHSPRRFHCKYKEDPSGSCPDWVLQE